MNDPKSAPRKDAHTPTNNIFQGNRVCRLQEYSCVLSHSTEHQRQVETNGGAEVVPAAFHPVKQGNRIKIIRRYSAKGGGEPPNNTPGEKYHHHTRPRQFGQKSTAFPHADKRKYHDKSNS